MDNLIEKIMATEYKYVFVAIIIMIVVFVLGAIAIQGMSNVIVDQGITYVDTVVLDKYLDENNTNSYIIIDSNNQTFDISNDDQGTKMFDSIIVGEHYRFTVKNDTSSSIIHIIQVYNDTN